MSNLKPMTKKERMLRIFIKLGVIGLNAEEAFPLGTTCLNSDVSKYKNEGIVFCRKRETIIRKRGGYKKYMRYWLSPDGIERAKRVVARLAKDRTTNK